MDYYARLGVPPTASKDEISAAFRDLSKQLHPDVEGGGDAEKMKLISEAYSTLKDPEKRAKYTPPSSSSSHPSQSSGHRGPKPADVDDLFRDIFRRAREPGSQERRSPPPPPPPRQESEHNPERIQRAAVSEARTGVSFFKMFVERLQREGYGEATKLIENQTIQEIVVSTALNEARIGASFYNTYVSSWARAGFKRERTDSHPKLFGLIKNDVISEARIGPFFFRTAVENWVRNNPALRSSQLIELPEIKEIVRRGAASERRIGESFYRTYIDSWKRAGVNI